MKGQNLFSSSKPHAAAVPAASRRWCCLLGSLWLSVGAAKAEGTEMRSGNQQLLRPLSQRSWQWEAAAPWAVHTATAVRKYTPPRSSGSLHPKGAGWGILQEKRAAEARRRAAEVFLHTEGRLGARVFRNCDAVEQQVRVTLRKT